MSFVRCFRSLFCCTKRSIEDISNKDISNKDTSNKDRKKFQSKLQNTAFNNVNTNRPVCKTKINCEFSTNSGECLCLAKKREKPEFIAI